MQYKLNNKYGLFSGSYLKNAIINDQLMIDIYYPLFVKLLADDWGEIINDDIKFVLDKNENFSWSKYSPVIHAQGSTHTMMH